MRTTYAILPNCNVRAMEGVISSLGKKGIPVIGLSTVSKCSAFHSKYVVKKIITPPTTNEDDFLDFLISKVPKGILYASDDQTTLLFSKNADLLKKEGFLINVPEYLQLKTGFDKWLCFKKASSIGIPCALSYKISCRNDLDFVKKNMPIPFILKATTLAGGNYVKVVNIKELETAYSTIKATIEKQKNCILDPEIIAQEWLEYEMEDIWCLESYYDKTGVPKGFMPVRKVRTEIKPDGTYGSRVYAGEACSCPELISLSRKLLDSLDWQGFAHFDWIYSSKKSRFFLTEINPRLPGFSFYPSNAGFEMAWYYYADLAGLPYHVPKPTPSLYFEPLRYPGDLTSAVSTVLRGQYSLKKIFSSYARIFSETKPVVFDFFDTNDLRMTTYNIFLMISKMLREVLGKIGI